MAGFLDDLVRRALAPDPGIRPRRRSRYETSEPPGEAAATAATPSPHDEIDAERVLAARPHPREPAQSARPLAPSPSPARAPAPAPEPDALAIDDASPLPALARPAENDPARTLVTPQVPAGIAEVAASAPNAHEADAPTLPITLASRPSDGRSAPAPPRAPDVTPQARTPPRSRASDSAALPNRETPQRAPARSGAREPIVGTPEPRPRATGTADGPGASPPPAIEVTIGRVEIRAMPSAPVARPTAAPRGLRLGDYLARREGRGR